MPAWVSFGWTSSAGILVIRNARSAALTTIRSTELGGTREPERGGGHVRARSSLGSRHSAHVTGSFAPGCSPGAGRFATASSDGDSVDDRRRRGPRDRRRPAPAEAPGCSSSTASAAPRRTSPTTSTRSRDDHRVVTFDHRGPRRERRPRRRRAPTRSTASRPTRSRSPTRSSSHDLRLLGHSMGGMVTRRVVLAQPGPRRRRSCSWTRRPGRRPGSTPTSSRSAAEVARTSGLAVLQAAAPTSSTCSDRPRYQRVLARAPGLPRVRRLQVGGAVAGDVGDARARDRHTSPTSSPSWRRSSVPDARASSASRTRTFLAPSWPTSPTRCPALGSW